MSSETFHDSTKMCFSIKKNQFPYRANFHNKNIRQTYVKRKKETRLVHQTHKTY